MKFKAGDHVRWIRAVPDSILKEVDGVVLEIVATDKVEAFNLYKVQFEFGTYTLYGTQLKVAAPPLNSAISIFAQVHLDSVSFVNGCTAHKSHATRRRDSSRNIKMRQSCIRVRLPIWPVDWLVPWGRYETLSRATD